jgi:hypothetical protein
VVPVSYHDFFGACATVAGALIGLLFVAISVSPEKIAGAKAIAEHQVRAAAAFSVLVDALVIALVALLPGARLGPAVVTLAAAGLASTAGLLILLYRRGRVRMRPGQVVLLVIPFFLYGLQLANGLALGGPSRQLSQIGNLGGLTIGFFAFAIARAWELVGLRDSSLMATVAGIAHQAASRETSHPPAPPPADQADHPPSDQQ